MKTKKGKGNRVGTLAVVDIIPYFTAFCQRFERGFIKKALSCRSVVFSMKRLKGLILEALRLFLLFRHMLPVANGHISAHLF